MSEDEKQEDTERTPDSSLTKAASEGGGSALPNEAISEQSPLSELPPELVDKMPPEVRAHFEQSIMMMRSGPAQDPIRQKITSQHISDIIEQTGEDNKREFESQKHGRWMALFVLALILGFVFALYYLFRDKPESVQPVLTHLIAFGGGIGGGMYLARKPH